MTIEGLSSYLLVNSNQYFVGSDIEVTTPILEQIVRRAINTYGNYRPRNVDIQVFVKDGLKFNKDEDGRTVISVSRLYYMNPIYDDTEIDMNWDWDRDSRKWVYQASGNLWANVSCIPLLSDLDYDQFEFLDMVQGLYLMYIGSNRKAFNMGDLPFENDGADLYNDGKELYETTLEKLSESNDSWYYGIM